MAGSALDLDSAKSAFNLNLADSMNDGSATTKITKGDILELSITTSSGTTSDQVIVAEAIEVTNYTAAGGVGNTGHVAAAITASTASTLLQRSRPASSRQHGDLGVNVRLPICTRSFSCAQVLRPARSA